MDIDKLIGVLEDGYLVIIDKNALESALKVA
jgi:hypothetical protein